MPNTFQSGSERLHAHLRARLASLALVLRELLALVGLSAHPVVLACISLLTHGMEHLVYDYWLFREVRGCGRWGEASD